MRLNNYLNENTTFQDEFIYKLLKKYCSEYLEIVKDSRFLFRGTRDIVIPGKAIKPRIDRKPKDMDYNIHELYDKAFYDKFGWKARSEGVFATTDHYDVKIAYGTPYYFWPFDGFKFIWSNRIKDLYNYTVFEINDFSDIPVIVDFVNDTVKLYKDTDLKRALECEVEIMFKCKAYYLTTNSYVDFIRGK
jgi:hypothetical protein